MWFKHLFFAPPPQKKSYVTPSILFLFLFFSGWEQLHIIGLRLVVWYVFNQMVPFFSFVFFYCLFKRFNSLELIAQVSFPDHLSFLCQSCEYYTFSSSHPEQLLLGQFQLNLAQSILDWKWVRFVYMNGLFQRWDFETLNRSIITKLGTENIFGLRGFKLVQMMEHALFQWKITKLQNWINEFYKFSPS